MQPIASLLSAVVPGMLVPVDFGALTRKIRSLAAGFEYGLAALAAGLVSCMTMIRDTNFLSVEQT